MTLETLKFVFGFGLATCAVLIMLPFAVASEILSAIGVGFTMGDIHWGKYPGKCPKCGGKMGVHGYTEFGYNYMCEEKECVSFGIDNPDKVAT